jgi:hypothetical protein
MSVTKAQLIGNVSGGAVFSGDVGIGTTTSPTTALDVNGDVTITDKIIHGGDTNTAIRFPAADTFTVETAGSERGRIDSSGRILVGTSTARDIEPYGLGGDGQTAHTYEDVGDTSPGPGIALGSSSSTDRFGPYLYLFRSRGGSVGSNTSVSSGDNLGTISFAGADGTDVRTRGAAIYCEVDGAVGINSMPGRLVFSTTAAGASTPTEGMRIDSVGNILIGQSTTKTPGFGNNTEGICLAAAGTGFFSRAAVVLRVNRTTDGAVVTFASAGVDKGNISISGNTVSYNGAHLSRWSQLSNNAERIEILRGSVLSNIDEMCEWGEEDNEQLNRMKVSDVEGDKNVSGVFQAWDDDDETYTNDFYCAMTGDFIIRIAADTTVERGDLLMSAGDGTAKPQDDDIIRSKTIAKVTSTNVSCTYDDGSYCVPCVLMAC